MNLPFVHYLPFLPVTMEFYLAHIYNKSPNEKATQSCLCMTAAIKSNVVEECHQRDRNKREILLVVIEPS